MPSAFGQPAVPRMGLIVGGPRAVDAVLGALREAGYVPGQTIIVEVTQTEGTSERYAPAIESMLKARMHILVVTSPHGLSAASKLTRTVPIVAVDLESDPVARGFVKSFARPGTNVTGFFLDLPELSGKFVQLVKEAVLGVSRIGVLWDAAIARAQFEATEKAAGAAGVGVHSAPVRSAGDLEQAVEEAVRGGAQALIILSAPVMRVYQARIDELALRHRLPSVTMFALLANGSGFMSYGPDLDDIYRSAVSYVDRILRGANVAELPLQRPSRFELAINLRTAKALAISVPPSLLLRADRVIGRSS
jgi:putative ABC transport system substrate-binding protein